MDKTVAVIGALDTKRDDLLFIRDRLSRAGHKVLLIDTSVVGSSGAQADITAGEIVEAAGGQLAALREKHDRGAAIASLCAGMPAVARKLLAEKRIHGIIALGGGAGTAVGTAAMRALPLGFPKVMVTTMASGVTRGYVEDKDIVLFPSIVDIAGVNAVSSRIYANAVGAMSGMLEVEPQPRRAGKALALTMYGNTTPVVERCKAQVLRQGYEALVFHANGVGGQALENLIAEGMVDGVMDITTTELADELVGGEASAGPGRLEAAGLRGLPQVVVPGCMDMVNFFAASGRHRAYQGRRTCQWNPEVILMRTTPEENRALGETMARKLNASSGKTAVALPLQGLSMLDAVGEAFWWPEADQALFAGLKDTLAPRVKVVELDCHINDPLFADMVVREFFELTAN